MYSGEFLILYQREIRDNFFLHWFKREEAATLFRDYDVVNI